ncbi:MAG: hypothetical protein MZV70_41205 [Desulfobacterales bacterium]|nr:hypothetical protein [Desulfobacterales bacterium]
MTPQWQAPGQSAAQPARACRRPRLPRLGPQPGIPQASSGAADSSLPPLQEQPAAIPSGVGSPAPQDACAGEPGSGGDATVGRCGEKRANSHSSARYGLLSESRSRWRCVPKMSASFTTAPSLADI